MKRGRLPSYTSESRYGVAALKAISCRKGLMVTRRDAPKLVDNIITFIEELNTYVLPKLFKRYLS